MAPSVDSATLSTASGILKNNYEGPIANMVANPTAFWAEVAKKSKGIEFTSQGAAVVFDLRMNLSQAVGSRAELSALPLPQRTRAVQTSVTLKSIYGVMRVTGQLMKASRTNPAAFARAVTFEAEGMRDSLKLDMARQAFGDGTGALATCGVTSASETIQLADDTNMNYFDVGMMVDIVTTSTGVAISNGDSREIESVDVANKTITLVTDSANVTTSAVHSVVREDSWNQEIGGLEKIIDDNTALHGVNPSTAGNERWKAKVDEDFGVFDEMKLQNFLDDIHTKSGEWPNRFYSDSGPRNEYFNHLIQQRRIVPQADMKLKGGFKGLAYVGGEVEAVWVKDAYAKNRKRVYCVNQNHIELRQAMDFEFIEVNGAHWLPEIYGSSGVDAYKAVFAKYCELITKKRSAHGRFDLALSS